MRRLVLSGFGCPAQNDSKTSGLILSMSCVHPPTANAWAALLGHARRVGRLQKGRACPLQFSLLVRLKIANAKGPRHITGDPRWTTMRLYKKCIAWMVSVIGEPPSRRTALSTTGASLPLALRCPRLCITWAPALAGPWQRRRGSRLVCCAGCCSRGGCCGHRACRRSSAAGGCHCTCGTPSTAVPSALE